jgi:hypothetical protein
MNTDINKNNKKLELKQLDIKKQNKFNKSNTNLFSLNKSLIKNNDEKNINFNLDNLQSQIPIQNSINIEQKISSNLNNLNNVNSLTYIENKINNNYKFFNENNFNTNLINNKNNVNNIRKIVNHLNNNNYSNNENTINNNIENQNNSGFLSIFPIIQDFNQIGQIIGYENNIDLFKKINDISTCVTRPCSDYDLFIEKKQNDIFVKDKDLFSEEEIPKNNNCKYINDNSNINEALNKDCNYPFYADQQELFIEQSTNNKNYKFYDMNEYKDIQKYQYFV